MFSGEPERLLLSRLAVFAGGWSLEAAEVVCADERIPPGDVLDLLAQLVSKSLVLADDVGDGSKRFRMLETVRHYGWERLLASGEVDTLHQRHALCFLEFGGSYLQELVLPSGLVIPIELEKLDAIAREQDNLRAALRWWIQLQDAERALKQAIILMPLWFWRNYLSEGQAAFEEILALPSAVASPDIRRRALPLLGHLAGRHGDYAVATATWQELLAVQEAAGDGHGAANTLVELANMHYLQGAFPLAWASLDASRAHAADLDDRLLKATQCQYGGQLALCEGRYDLARRLATEASTLFESENKPDPEAYAQMTLGNVELEEGHLEEARLRFLRRLQVALDFGDRTLLAHLLEGFSGVATARGQHQRAFRLGGAAAAVREAAGDPLRLAWRRVVERRLAISRQALGEKAASAAWEVGRSMPMERVLEEAADKTREAVPRARGVLVRH